LGYSIGQERRGCTNALMSSLRGWIPTVGVRPVLFCVGGQASGASPPSGPVSLFFFGTAWRARRFAMSSVRSMCGGVAVASAAAVCVARTIFSTRTRSERLIRLGAFACVALLAPLHASGDLIFYNGNPYGVSNGGAPPQFTITSEYLITNIVDYHWNYGQGTATPGTISLARSGGTTYGPWQTTGLPGMYGVPNAYWSLVQVLIPLLTLPQVLGPRILPARAWEFRGSTAK
jgi:hypothetical protein